MPESFMDGMKDAMSLFMMSSLASNYDAQRENMAENRQLRADNLERQALEDKRQTMQADMSMLGFVSNPKSNVPLDVAVNQANKFAVKYGFGQNVSMQDVQKYNDELSILPNQDLPTGAERKALFQPYAEKAGTHVAYAITYGKHAQQIEDWLAKPGAQEAFKTAGFTPESTNKLLDNLRPSEALAMLKDGDYRKAALYNQASQAVTKVLSGEDVPEGELAQSLTAAYGAGFKVGPDAAEIVKGTTGEQQYNLAQKDLNSLNQTAVKPLSKLWGMLDPDKVNLTMARRSPTASLSTIGLAADDQIAAMLPQEQQKAFHESVANIEASYDHASKMWKDFDARYRIAKANPSTTQSDLVLLDQQRMIEQQKYRAIAAPFIAYKTYTDAPSEENFNKVLTASSKMDETIRRLEADKQQLMTVSEQAQQQTIATGKMTAANTKATNEFGTEFMRMAGEHPEIYDQDGVMDISKASKLAAPIADSINAKYGANLDASQVIKEFASAAKRSVPPSDTMMKLTPEQGVKFVQMEMGLEGVQTYRNIMTLPDGSFDRKKLFTQTLRLPFSDGRTTDAVILETAEGKIRLESGAAVPDNEITRLAKRALPLVSDSDATIRTKLALLDSFYSKSLDVIDPRKILRSRTANSTETITKAAQGEKPAAKATPSQEWGPEMETKAKSLLQQHPDWGVEQIYKALTEGQ